MHHDYQDFNRKEINTIARHIHYISGFFLVQKLMNQINIASIKITSTN